MRVLDLFNRYRLWLAAYSSKSHKSKLHNKSEQDGSSGIVSNTGSQGLQSTERYKSLREQSPSTSRPIAECYCPVINEDVPQIPIGFRWGRRSNGNKGGSAWPLQTEGRYPLYNGWRENWPEVALRTCVQPLDDGTSRRLSRHRRKQLKAIGNGIVPQIPYIFFQYIKEIERSMHP